MKYSHIKSNGSECDCPDKDIISKEPDREGYNPLNQGYTGGSITQTLATITNIQSGIIIPPLGLKPKGIHDYYRKSDILAAMTRYVEAGKCIPDEWIDELKELNE